MKETCKRCDNTEIRIVRDMNAINVKLHISLKTSKKK